MRRIATGLIVLGMFLSWGCVSKKQYEAAQAELNRCGDEKAQLEASVIVWEQRFDRESGRWEDLGASISGAVPKALSEFHEERERILKLVPEQVEAEVNAYLEDYFSTVMRGFQLLKSDNEEIKMQLEATQDALTEVGSDTRSISETVDRRLADERQRRAAENARREQMASRLSELVAQVAQFDQDRINSRSGADRLKLNRKEKEAILGFHAEVMSSLSEIQSLATSNAVEPETVQDAPPASTESEEEEG